VVAVASRPDGDAECLASEDRRGDVGGGGGGEVADDEVGLVGLAEAEGGEEALEGGFGVEGEVFVVSVGEEVAVEGHVVEGAETGGGEGGGGECVRWLEGK